MNFTSILSKKEEKTHLEAAVTRSDRNEPVINEDFAALAEFYDMAVYSARAKRRKKYQNVGQMLPNLGF